MIKKNSDILDYLTKFKEGMMKSSRISSMFSQIENTVLPVELERELKNMLTTSDGRVYNPNLDHRYLTDNAYFKNIKIKDTVYKDFRYGLVDLPERLFIRTSYPVFEKNACRYYTNYGYCDKALSIPVLYEDDKVWMSITPMEIATAEDAISKATGDVLAFGLGLGYYPYMCSLKESVKSVTIVEKDKDIIDMFKTQILPQFDNIDKINIINGDMYDYLNESFLNRFNRVFVDVWSDDEDGLEHYTKISKKDIDYSKIDFWIEDSLLQPVVMLIIAYINSYIADTHKSFSSNFSCDLKSYAASIERFFKKTEISSASDIKNIIENPCKLREVLKS